MSRLLALSFFILKLLSFAYGQAKPVLHVTFDTGASDVSGGTRHGNLRGASIVTDAKVGAGAVLLDGIDDYISFPVGIYFEGAYSIALWSKMMEAREWTRFLDFNQDQPATGNAVTWLIGRNDSGAHNMWFDQWITVDGKAIESIADFSRTSPADAYLQYNVTLADWHHYTITYEADSTVSNMATNTKNEVVPLQGIVKLYVDGELHSSSKFCLKPQEKPTTANWLGRSRYAADPYYHGFLDDFRIYDVVLTPAEVRQLYELAR